MTASLYYTLLYNVRDLMKHNLQNLHLAELFNYEDKSQFTY